MIPRSRFGPLVSDRGVIFRLWAPGARRVELLLDAPVAMTQRGAWFETHVVNAAPGTRYRFRVDGEIEIPDPASHFQPEDVNGPSEVIGHGRYQWRTRDWMGRPWEEAVFLEAHVGTFTREGSFKAVIDRLDHLVETGVSALELMPVADFPGRWNWGYDGVLLFAPDSSYGRPDDLKALVDAAHARGLMMFLDVVYNHFGPEGNYLGRIAPRFFADAHTPWGVAIDYREPEVRAFVIENALHWLRDYRFDGLRLDAVHAIVVPGEENLLTELSRSVDAFATESGRRIHLVLENDDNAARFLAPAAKPVGGFYRAQWNDDYHHAWHVLLTHESAGYYRDYQNASAHIARALGEGFSYQGEASLHREGRPRGEPSADLPRADFVNFLQNHDQIGNRPKGERLTALAKPEAIEAALAVLLLQPGPPLMFMGEEWGADEPFPFFCDFQGELAEAVRQGRRREFAEAYAAHGDEIPDPLAPETRAAAVLDWNARAQPRHAHRLAFIRALLAARRKWVAPRVPVMVVPGEVRFEGGLLTAIWSAGEDALVLLANLSDEIRQRPPAWGVANREVVWGGTPPHELPPWSVYAALESR